MCWLTSIEKGITVTQHSTEDSYCQPRHQFITFCTTMERLACACKVHKVVQLDNVCLGKAQIYRKTCGYINIIYIYIYTTALFVSWIIGIL